MAIRLLSSETLDGTLTVTGNVNLHYASSPTLSIKDTTNDVNLLLYSQNADSHIGTYSNHNLKIDTNSTLALTIDNSQNATFSGDVMPAAENLYDIGSASVRWEGLYVDDGYIRTAHIDSYIYHNGNTNNHIRFQTNRMQLFANFGTAGYLDLHDNGNVYIGASNATAVTITSSSATFSGGIIANGAITATGITTSGSATFGSPLTIKAASPYIKWEKADGTRLAYIQHNETNLVIEADTGIIILDADTQINGTLGITSNVNTSGLLTATRLDTNSYLSNGTAADLYAGFLGQAIYGSGTGSGDNYGSVADVFRYKEIAVWRKNSSTNAWSNPSTGNSLIEGNYAHKWGGVNMEPAYSEYVFYFSNTLGYSFVSQTILQHSTNGNSFDCYLERASSTTNPYDTTGWTTMVTKTGVSSWPGLTSIQKNWEIGGGYPGLFRIRLVPTWNNSNVINLGSFQAYGSYGNFGHAWSTTYDRKVNFQSMIGVGTNPSRALDVTQTALIQGPGNVNAGTLALGPRSSGAGKWSSITGAHYNQASGSGNGSGSAGIMMIGTYGANGENDVYIGGGLYEVNAATAIRFYTHTTDTSTAGGSPRMTILANGNVGIGSTNPSGVKFQSVQTTSGEWTGDFKNYTANGYGLRVDMSNSSSVQSALQVYTGTGNGFVVKNTGNVGVGTNTPDKRLTVGGVDPTEGINLKTKSGSSVWTIWSVEQYFSQEGYMRLFYDNVSTIQFRADGDSFFNGGDVGIGTTSPSVPLQVHGQQKWYTTSVDGNELRGFFNPGGSGDDAELSVYKADGSTEGVVWRGTGNSYVRIDSTVLKFINFYYGPTNVGQIVTGGTNVLYQSNSDYRLKENVTEMTGALDRVSQLKPSRYNFISHPKTQVDGFMAHELQEVVPQAVSGQKDEMNEDGTPKYQGVDHSQVVPLLVGAIKELKAEVEELKKQIK